MRPEYIIEELEATLQEQLSDRPVFTGEEEPEEEIGRLLVARGFSLAVAESCTGGLLAHRLTNVPGSSRYFLLGVVAYSNAAKVALLGVSEEVLAREGAVSETVAGTMASGVRRLAGADVGIGITGIAGPDGGTPAKPVGLVYLGLDVGGRVQVERVVFAGDRLSVKEQAAQQALAMLRQSLRGADR